jgi:hypothetical protein
LAAMSRRGASSRCAVSNDSSRPSAHRCRPEHPSHC